MNRAAALALLACVIAVPASAAEPRGCDKFAWNIEGEQARLAGPVQAAHGQPLDRTSAEAIAVTLAPLAHANLPKPPERAPKNPSSLAGAAAFAAGAGTATYRISISAYAWIDVIQDGAYVKSGKFSGALDCAGIRKSVEFTIGPAPFVVQVSDVDSGEIRMVLTPSE